jgi:hypothetical protein
MLAHSFLCAQSFDVSRFGLALVYLISFAEQHVNTMQETFISFSCFARAPGPSGPHLLFVLPLVLLPCHFSPLPFWGFIPFRTLSFTLPRLSLAPSLLGASFLPEHFHLCFYDFL